MTTAVVRDAQAVVTLNLKDLPLETCEPFAISLLDLYGLDAGEVYEALLVPSFVQAIRAHRQ